MNYSILLLLATASAQRFDKKVINGKEAVSVFDQDDKPLYGVILGENDTYEQLVDRHMNKGGKTVCAVNAQDKDIEYLGVMTHLR